MMKSRVVAMFMASLVLFYTSCSEKEIPQPVEDTERIDALRAELRELIQVVYGETVENAMLEGESVDLNASIAELRAEIEELKAIYNQTTTYQVIAIDFQGQVIPGASVTLNQNGQLFTATTNDDGHAEFRNVRVGAIAGVVAAEGFSTANYTASLAGGESGGPIAGANTRVPLLPKHGALADAGLFTITGHLYANINAANDTATSRYYYFAGSNPEHALSSGPNEDAAHRTYEVQTRRIAAAPYVNLLDIPFSIYNTDARGAIRRLAYEQAVYEATFDSNGKYTIKLPINSVYSEGVAWLKGSSSMRFYFNVEFEEFVATKTLVDYDPNGTQWDGSDYIPNSAYPAPKTYTESRVFKIDQTDFSPDYFGTELGAQAGDIYEVDFFYQDYKN